MYVGKKKELEAGEFLDEKIIPGAVRADPLETVDVPVDDARGLEMSLATEGFCLAKHDGPFEAADLSSQTSFDKWVLDTALPKLAEVLTATLERDFGMRVAAAHTIDYTLRAVDAVPIQSALPVLDAHADFTPESGLARLVSEKRSFKVGEPEILPDHEKVMLVNIWQPLVSTVFRHPLVVCSLKSVDDSSYVRKQMIYEHRVGEVFGIRRVPDQKWFYYPHMTSQEALVFISWTQDGRTVPHSGVVDAKDDDLIKRRSLETRWAVKLRPIQ